MTDIADLTFPKFPKDLALHGTTDLDVAAAIAGDKAFPDRPDGVIDIGHVPDHRLVGGCTQSDNRQAAI